MGRRRGPIKAISRTTKVILGREPAAPGAFEGLCARPSRATLPPMSAGENPEPIGRGRAHARAKGAPAAVAFSRSELTRILGVYGQFVAAGDWKDYAIDCLPERAVFSVFRRASEMPLYRIEKRPKLARRQGQWTIVSMSGAILKRGHDLGQVLRLFDRQRLKLAT